MLTEGQLLTAIWRWHSQLPPVGFARQRQKIWQIIRALEAL